MIISRLMNLDCELAALGTKLFTVKEKIAAEARYGAAVVANKTHNTTDKIKKEYNDTVKEIKSKTEELKNQKYKTETAKKSEPVKETKSAQPVKEVVSEKKEPVKEKVTKDQPAKPTTKVEIKDTDNKIERVEAEIVEETPLTKGVTYAPDFEPYEKVTIPHDYEIPKSVVPDEKILKEVKTEDVVKAYSRMQNKKQK